MTRRAWSRRSNDETGVPYDDESPEAIAVVAWLDQCCGAHVTEWCNVYLTAAMALGEHIQEEETDTRSTSRRSFGLCRGSA